MSRRFPRPTVVISRCLGLDACRYDGARVPFGLLDRLRPHVRFLPVCPEVEIGLGTPRDPIRLVAGGGGRRLLVQPATGRDLTKAMAAFSRKFLDGLAGVDGFILKARSPSCGVRDAKVFGAARGAAPGRGPGLFARAVLERFPGLAVEDEGRLLGDPARRAHFLTKLFTLAAFRRVRENPSARGLARFHDENRLLLGAHNRAALRAMDCLLATAGARPIGGVLGDYQAQLHRALARPARRGAAVRAPYPEALMEAEGPKS